MKKPLSEMTLSELWALFPIALKAHNPNYKKWYAAEYKQLLKLSFNQDIKRINHIGSSVVEGLIAKPIVDILLEITPGFDTGPIISELKEDGWILMHASQKPEMKLSFNKGYTPDGFAEKVFHLHVRYYGDHDELYFRDYLLTHKEIADAYGKIKCMLLKEYKHNRDGYTKAKTEFVQDITARARKEFGGRYAPEY